MPGGIMLAYLIIAFELAVLYTIFWYIFLRQPKRPKISLGLWGRYGADRDSVVGDEEKELHGQMHG